MMRILFSLFFCLAFVSAALAHQGDHEIDGNQELSFSPYHTDEGADFEFDAKSLETLGCLRANSTQMQTVNAGNQKKEQFLARCRAATENSPWCDQLVRPNPDSISTFRCTYGSTQLHQLIHPTESTWTYPIRGVQIINELTAKGIKVCRIYNWWRPEPYNQNVGGAAGRHPFGTAIDVRFCSNADANRAFTEMCKMRRQGRLRALGHYGGSALHIGVGDSNANTWGRSCPSS